jgi:hypothetical protein
MCDLSQSQFLRGGLFPWGVDFVSIHNVMVFVMTCAHDLFASECCIFAELVLSELMFVSGP